jgi:hypothetical protein
MGGFNQSVLRTTPSGDIELASHQYSEEVEVNGNGLWKMRTIFPRMKQLNIWDHGSLKRSGKIFHSNFNHDYREKDYRSSEHPKIFMLEVVEIQVAPIAVVSSFVRAYPEEARSNLEFSAESHFWSIYKAEFLFATE